MKLDLIGCKINYKIYQHATIFGQNTNFFFEIKGLNQGKKNLTMGAA